MKWIFGIVFLGFSVAAHAEIVNLQAEGNLETTDPAGCVEINGLKNTQTPADIFVGFSSCLSDEKYEKASSLFITAKAYGVFDMRRVKDKTAHQAIRVLQMNASSRLKEIYIKAFGKHFKAMMNNAEQKQKMCEELVELGSPNYLPRYMMQHGMSAFTGKDGGLVEDFSPEDAWGYVIKDYVKCL